MLRNLGVPAVGDSFEIVLEDDPSREAWIVVLAWDASVRLAAVAWHDFDPITRYYEREAELRLFWVNPEGEWEHRIPATRPPDADEAPDPLAFLNEDDGEGWKR